MRSSHGNPGRRAGSTFTVRLALVSALVVLSAACSFTVPEGLVTESGGTDPTPVPAETTVPGGGGDTTIIGEIAGTTIPGEVTVPTPARDPRVGEALRSLGPWKSRELPPFTDDRTLAPDSFESNGQIVTCAPALESRTFRPGTFEEFASFPFSGPVMPGLIVEGRLIEEADLEVLPLDRAPLPLVVNLASESPAIVVDQPSPSSTQQAVADLMRAADARVSGLPVVPANIRFVQREVSSYEEAILSMGVSLRYDSPDLKAEFESSFEQQTGLEKHSVMVRLLQPMFTISTDRSQVTGPGDYFSPTVSMDQVDALVGQGRIGSDNPPVMIDAVTYGRVVYITVTSSKVTSQEELKVAVSGAYKGFSGEADLETRNKSIMNEAEIQVEAYGGNDDVALNALKTGQIQDFMESVDTSTAAPLSMVLRTLDGTKLTVTDEATITDIGCTRQDKPNTVGLQLDIGSSTWVTVRVNGSEIGTWKADTQPYIDLTSHLRTDSNNRVELVYQPPTCAGGSMNASFHVNGQAYRGRQWRIAGVWNEWACAETGTWNVDAAAGTAALVDGPPALRKVAGD